MSQYFKSVFNFVLFNYLICLSYCDKQSYQVLFFNDSVLEITENFDSNSSLYNQNQISTRNNSKVRSDTDQYSNQCQEQCSFYERCCPYDPDDANYSYYCVKLGTAVCKKYNYEECKTTDDCESRFSLRCLPSKKPWISRKDVCRCEDDHYFDHIKKRCDPLGVKYDSGSSMQIYKITMIFASCCLALILIIFLVCILRKSYCAPRRQVVPLDNTTIPDIFTLFPHIGNYDGGPLADGTLPPFEKPPTYDETLTLIRNEIGIPPPAYRSGNNSNQSSPSMSTRILITNPTLFTVSDESNSRTNSGPNSSSDESLAGPSGSGASRQGIDNPAFC